MEPIKIILNSHNVKIAQDPFQTSGHIFAKARDPVTKEQQTDTIYSIPCKDCNNEYTFENAILFCKKENSVLSEHTCLIQLGGVSLKLSPVIGERLCLEL